jgi:drug/metabolite transporter (DMT)-like permease
MGDVTAQPHSRPVRGAVCGLASAALFGLSAPLAKLLLPHVDPWLLAGLFYLGAGVGLTAVRIVRRPAAGATHPVPRRLDRGDWYRLTAIAVIGGGIGPVLLLVGLTHVSGVAGSLLLNLEAVFTMLLAVAIFGERLTLAETLAATLVLLGAALVSLERGIIAVELAGVLAIAAACLAWGLDNNLTARLSHWNAIDLVRIKTVTAGSGNLALAIMAGRSMPPVSLVAISCVLGFVCYGLSIVLDVYALRYVGAAREAAFFATAPFAGALAALPLLHEPLGMRQLAGAAVMAVGVFFRVMWRSRQPLQP